MKGFQMVKEIYICKELQKISNSNKPLKDKLNGIAKLIYENYEIKLNFCEIFGNRWSFYAGFNDLIVAEERIRISDNFGILVENINIDNCTWNEILFYLKKTI